MESVDTKHVDTIIEIEMETNVLKEYIFKYCYHIVVTGSQVKH
jgi:hypothetical protein